MKKVFNGLSLAGFLFVLTSCAIQVGPQGGPKDILPPVIIKESPASKTVNFNKDKITLFLNEYSKLNNINQEMIISPLINPIPKISSRKKTIEIKFEQKLKDSTTYTIQFGKSIADITENNILNDYSFVFSTGAKLDSLELKGRVIEVQNNTVNENIKIMLHPLGSDSSVYKAKPEYYSKTNKAGEYGFKNLHNSSYRIYALEDANGNYVFDKGEKIAFANEVVDLKRNQIYPELKLFKEKENKIKVLDYGQKEKNKFYIALNATADSFKLGILEKGILTKINKNYKISERGDTVLFWIKPVSDSFDVVIENWGENYSIDTINFITITDKKDLRQSAPTKLTIKPKMSLFTTGKIQIDFNMPVTDINTSNILFYRDSIKTTNLPEIIFEDSSYSRALIKFKYDLGKNYKLIFNKGVVNGFNKVVNDSIVIPINTMKETELGIISVNLIIGKRGTPIILQLLNSKQEVLRENIYLETTKTNYNNLIPGKYFIRCIKDQNKNGKWDTGNLLKGRQPEEIIYFKDDINLKENWELNDLMIKVQ